MNVQEAIKAARAFASGETDKIEPQVVAFLIDLNNAVADAARVVMSKQQVAFGSREFFKKFGR